MLEQIGMNVKRKDIAFFDIDNTILRIDSSRALIKMAYRKGIMSTLSIIKAVYAGIQYKYSMRDTQKIIHKMGKWLNGISEDMFAKICHDIFKQELLPNIRPNIIKEINQLKENGTEVVILSSAVTTICKPIGKYLNIDAVICTELEVEEGKFTGHPVGKFCFRDEKLVRLKAFCEKRNVNLENAAYYADSIDDLPALQQVGFPVCVSPDKKLSRIAEQRGWLVQNW